MDFTIPSYLSSDCRDLLRRLLEANHSKRITIPEICEHPWHRKGLPPKAIDMNDTYLQVLILLWIQVINAKIVKREQWTAITGTNRTNSQRGRSQGRPGENYRWRWHTGQCLWRRRRKWRWRWWRWRLNIFCTISIIKNVTY